jgi:mitogen-activated protein kinase organizer 1
MASGVQQAPQKVHVTLEGHKGPVNVARYSKGTAKYILTGGQDRSVRLWNANLGSEIKTFTAHGYEILSVAVYVVRQSENSKQYSFWVRTSSSHDNAKFVSSGGDRSVFLWDVTTGVTSRRISGHMGKIFAVEFNEDATVVASGVST